MLQGGLIMGDIFAEQLVKRKKKPSEQFLKYALTALVVVFALGGLFVNGMLVYLALALVVACYFVFPRFNVEYEYSYVNGEFDIDVIYSMQKRKKKEVFNLQDVDCVALYGNPALAPYQTGYTVSLCHRQGRGKTSHLHADRGSDHSGRYEAEAAEKVLRKLNIL